MEGRPRKEETRTGAEAPGLSLGVTTADLASDPRLRGQDRVSLLQGLTQKRLLGNIH